MNFAYTTHIKITPEQEMVIKILPKYEWGCYISSVLCTHNIKFETCLRTFMLLYISHAQKRLLTHNGRTAGIDLYLLVVVTTKLCTELRVHIAIGRKTVFGSGVVALF